MRNNNIALITGSSHGLGLEIAKKLSDCHFTVILTGRSRERLDEALSQLNEGNHIAFPLDFTCEDELDKLMEFLFHEKLIPNIIIHNVGGRVDKDHFPLSLETLRISLAINLEIAIKINEKILPHMIQNNFGRIIHIGSDASLTGQASPAYVIAKSALNGYVKSAARYYAKQNVMVCAVLPGILDHEGSVWAEKKIHNPEYYQKKLEQMPLGRFGKPEEIAHFVAELACNHSMMCAGSLFEFRGAVS